MQDAIKPILVIKYGGNAMTNEDLKKQVLQNICSLQSEGYSVVIVHGGGPFIKQALMEAEITSEFIDGHRKTSPEALKYVEMALKGQVNGSLVNIINHLGYSAVGLSGKDGKMATAVKRMHRKIVDGKVREYDLGQVGDIASIDPKILKVLLEQGYIPVITCLASDEQGNDYNINADMFAGHVAGALKAEQYIVMTDVDGLMRDKDDPDTIISTLHIADADQLVEEKIIQGGMLPKIASCEIAIKNGAKSARIINGTKPEQILAVVKEDTVGTIIKK